MNGHAANATKKSIDAESLLEGRGRLFFIFLVLVTSHSHYLVTEHTRNYDLS
jgi:hypothetical protein